MNRQEIPIKFDERLDEVNEQIRLIQKKNGLTYGTDAFLLAAFVRPIPHGTAVDLGSGTGIIPLLLAARRKVAKITAVEIQESFAELIKRNAELNGFDRTITPLCEDLRNISAYTIGGEVDLVVSNPPYMKCNTGKRNSCDEKYIARHEVCGSIADFCDAARRLLRYGGRFVTVWRPDRLTDLLYALHSSALEPKRMTFVYADAQSEPCMVLTEAVKGGAPSLRIGLPLLLYEIQHEPQKNRVLTSVAQKIYDTCSFDNI